MIKRLSNKIEKGNSNKLVNLKNKWTPSGQVVSRKIKFQICLRYPLMVAGINTEITMISRLEVIMMEKRDKNQAKMPANHSW
jgi:hypothetical protein